MNPDYCKSNNMKNEITLSRELENLSNGLKEISKDIEELKTFKIQNVVVNGREIKVKLNNLENENASDILIESLKSERLEIISDLYNKLDEIAKKVKGE